MADTTMEKVTNLTVHPLQEKLSPYMSKQKWGSWFDSFAEKGIQYAIYATPNGKVYNGKHRLKATIELGLAEIPVIYEDIDEAEIIERIIADKLEHDDLTIGQHICIEINRAYEEGLIEEAEQNKLANLKQNTEGTSGYYRGGTAELIRQRLGNCVGVKIVKQAMSLRNKKRDLYDKVFAGYDENGKEVKIGTVYKIMKEEESPKQDTKPKEVIIAEQEEEKEIISETVGNKSVPLLQELPKQKEGEKSYSPNNRLLRHLNENIKDFIISLPDAFDAFINSDDDSIREVYLDQIKIVADSTIRILMANDKERLRQILGGIYNEEN